jgi:mercuric ion transport protein
MADEQKKYRNRFIASLVGTGVVALCCFTPVLVILLAAVDLAAFTPYLDFVLFPALAALILLTVTAYRKWRNASRSPE